MEMRSKRTEYMGQQEARDIVCYSVYLTSSISSRERADKQHNITMNLGKGLLKQKSYLTLRLKLDILQVEHFNQ